MKSKILRDVVNTIFLDVICYNFLFAQISFYLSKAELCKNKNEAQQLDIDMAKIKEDTALDNTIVDESNINTEKKQQSATQQNCCLQ